MKKRQISSARGAPMGWVADLLLIIELQEGKDKPVNMREDRGQTIIFSTIPLEWPQMSRHVRNRGN
jgi:hypothetical protein